MSPSLPDLLSTCVCHQWVAIVSSAVFVFLGSWILHMCLTHHHTDFRKVPGEERIMEELRTSKVPVGQYRFPYCKMEDFRSEETTKKFTKGPVGILTVVPSGPPAMGKQLIQWFAYCLSISLLVGVVCQISSTKEILAVALIPSLLVYVVSGAHNSIWKGEAWGVTLKNAADGVVYSLITAASFHFLWNTAK